MTYRAAHKIAPKAKPTIYYPETDHQPMPDAEYQAPIYRKVVSTLEFHLSKIPGALVNGNVFIYFAEGNPRRTIAPDCYTSYSISRLRRFNPYRCPRRATIPTCCGKWASRPTSSWK